jgi:TRAP-type mannitol/chloroaromatic compound transport system permease small subunit
MARPPEALLKAIRFLDAIGAWSGRVVAWLVLPLVLGLTYEVIARYVFDAPTAWAYDIAYMLYGSHFMLGAGYCLLKKGHIRTDIFYAKWTPQRQGWVDAVSYLFLFFPGMVFFLLAGWDSAYHSWMVREVSEASPWRPPIYPFKMTVPVAALLLLIQGVSEFLKSLHAALKREWI